MDKQIQSKALSFSIIDGALSAIMGSLVSGIFLIGFALKILDAQPQQIGILAALPMFANLVQIFGSYIIEKTGKRKALCLFCVASSRILWALIMALPLRIFSPVSDWRVWILVGVIGLSSLFGSLSGVAWLSWMSDLVPENIRGTYFGKRNMIASFCGMLTLLFAGRFLTYWESSYGELNPFGFIILFAAGLSAGLLAVWFLLRIPEPQSAKSEKNIDFNFSLFLQPLKDRNFLKLIIFVAAWLFAVQIAAPFYGVFMIENLAMDFSAITLFGTIATLATLLMMKIWGPISDKLGNKPIIIVSGWALIIVPFLWILALPEKFYLPLLIAHILSGAFMAGASLSQFNILIKLTPKEGRSVYLAIFAAITGFMGAIAPIAGGAIAGLFAGINYRFFAYDVSSLQVVFVASAFLQALTIFFILKVQEPAAAAPVAVIMQLKNDLNPQTGIASAADFLMVELKRSESILKRVDRATDKLAEKSEEKIERVLSRAEKVISKPLERLKKFFKTDSNAGLE